MESLHISKHMLMFPQTLTGISPANETGPEIWSLFRSHIILREKISGACDSKECAVDKFLGMYLKIHSFSISITVKLPLLNCRAFTFVNPDWCIKDDESGRVQSLGKNKRVVCTTIPKGQLTAEVMAAKHWDLDTLTLPC